MRYLEWSNIEAQSRNGNCQGLGNGELLFVGIVSILQDKKVLEKGSSDGYTTMRTYLMSPNCTLENDPDDKFYVSCVFP